jgi:hypothetical protein
MDRIPLRVCIVAAVLLGCASTQRVVLDAEPRPLDVYVNGRLEPAPAEEIELLPDRRHTLYFKKPGYRSELVLMEPSKDGEMRRLEPAVVRVRLCPRRDKEGAASATGSPPSLSGGASVSSSCSPGPR